ncbi:hypothetical protein M404DRAFT_994733, partial [Pisolithus tinctorius Marx 270]
SDLWLEFNICIYPSLYPSVLPLSYGICRSTEFSISYNFSQSPLYPWCCER